MSGVAERVRFARKRRGLPMHALAARAGLSSAYVLLEGGAWDDPKCSTASHQRRTSPPAPPVATERVACPLFPCGRSRPSPVAPSAVRNCAAVQSGPLLKKLLCGGPHAPSLAPVVAGAGRLNTIVRQNENAARAGECERAKESGVVCNPEQTGRAAVTGSDSASARQDDVRSPGTGATLVDAPGVHGSRGAGAGPACGATHDSGQPADGLAWNPDPNGRTPAGCSGTTRRAA